MAFLSSHTEYTYSTMMAEPEFVIEGKMLLDSRRG